MGTMAPFPGLHWRSLPSPATATDATPVMIFLPGFAEDSADYPPYCATQVRPI